MANAQFRVDFVCELPSDHGGNGDQWRKSVYLSSPDLVDTKEAYRRAKETAKARLMRQHAKDYPHVHKRISVKIVGAQCVG